MASTTPRHRQQMNTMSATGKDHLIDRLASFSEFINIPRTELKWLVEHSHFAVHEAGTIVAPKGKRIDHLYIMLSGKMAIRVDRGAGPRLVAEWQAGEISGMLPYSRMKGPPGNAFIDENAETLAIHVKLFPEMIHHCPLFTAFTVHTMLDRARNFNTSDLQDEKMISLGKLSAGLAHELNNPASAAVRDAKLLLEGLTSVDAASRALGAANLTESQFNKIDQMRAVCLEKSNSLRLSPIEKSDHQDKISDWLVSNKMNPAFAAPLADTCLTIDQLANLASTVPDEALDTTLSWFVAKCTTHLLAIEIERALTQIHRVVDAVKKFTYMDNLAEKEFVDVEAGIRDTMSILVAKIHAKNAVLSFEIDKNLPRVCANGSDLNQVWFSLLDNALDAIPKSGNIRIKSGTELNRVLVCVVDDGPGIASDVISRIFDPFYTTKPPGQGTGLGLDIARRLLRRYHGDINVQSQPGRTEFRVSLVVEKPVPADVNQENKNISGEKSLPAFI